MDICRFLYTAGELIRPKTEPERRRKSFWALVMLVVVISSYGYYIYTK
jgi:hypothetical protein